MQACQFTEKWMETSINAPTILLKWVSMDVWTTVVHKLLCSVERQLVTLLKATAPIRQNRDVQVNQIIFDACLSKCANHSINSLLTLNYV